MIIFQQRQIPICRTQETFSLLECQIPILQNKTYQFIENCKSILKNILPKRMKRTYLLREKFFAIKERGK